MTEAMVPMLVVRQNPVGNSAHHVVSKAAKVASTRKLAYRATFTKHRKPAASAGLQVFYHELGGFLGGLVLAQLGAQLGVAGFLLGQVVGIGEQLAQLVE